MRGQEKPFAGERCNVMVRFPEGFPMPLLAARVAFFVVVGLILMFGIDPFRFEVAKNGITGCVFALVGSGGRKRTTRTAQYMNSSGARYCHVPPPAPNMAMSIRLSLLRIPITLTNPLDSQQYE